MRKNSVGNRLKALFPLKKVFSGKKILLKMICFSNLFCPWKFFLSGNGSLRLYSACACDSELDSCHMQLFEFHLALVSHLWRMPQIWAPKHSYGCSEYSLLLVHIHQKWKKIAPKIASVIELSKLLSGVKNIHVVPTDPIFFCRPYYFFNAIDHATLFSPGGCGLLIQRAKMASNTHL
jgi:hypothetical protein